MPLIQDYFKKERLSGLIFKKVKKDRLEWVFLNFW